MLDRAAARRRSIRSSVLSRYSPPNAPGSDRACRYSLRAPIAIVANAATISTCHSHQAACQVVENTTAIMASASST